MTSPNRHYLKSWLLFFLIATIGGAVAGGILGVVGGGVMGAGAVPMDRIILVCKILGFLAGMPISFFTFRWSVRTYIVEPMLESAAQPPVSESA